MQKKCTTSCVKKYTRKRRRTQKGGATTGVLPTIFTNLIDSVSHSAVSTIDVFNGYPVGDSPSTIFSTLQTTAINFFLFF